MSKPFYTIAVTGLNAVDNPGPGVPVIRSLKEARSFDCRIVGFCYEMLEPGAYMKDLVDVCYQVPYPSAGTELLLARLKQIQEKEHIDVVIPNFDAELFSYVKLRSELLNMGIHLFLPSYEQFEARQKYNLADFCSSCGMNVPRSYNCISPEAFFKEGWKFPVVLKGKYYEAYIVSDKEQFLSVFSRIVATWGGPAIVQEFIEGSEFNLIGCCDVEGQLLAAVPMRKQYITEKGKAWAGVTIKDGHIMDLAQKFVAGGKWCGAFELELIKAKDGRLYLLEVNPRIPAWVYLSTAAGVNIPEMLVNCSMGNPVAPLLDYEVGKMFIRYSWDMVVDQSEFAEFSVTGEKHNR
ncbi:MAG: ATP-grasp domain-containing protein [Paludibacteraceae bacterium]|nr:ATP-grasp domain-containing protein [Paludibacteraceae bacterium]